MLRYAKTPKFHLLALLTLTLALGTVSCGETRLNLSEKLWGAW